MQVKYLKFTEVLTIRVPGSDLKKKTKNQKQTTNSSL